MAMTSCPECGAPDGACEARYHECLVKEFTDAVYGAVHHLTVAAYMLQHSSKLSRDGWLEMRRLLRAFLDENKGPVEVRQQNAARVDSGRRDWKIASKDGSLVIQKAAWTKTVLDVHLENAEAYCADVTAWARAALDEAEPLEV
jgi:hypothetical protein